MIKAQGKVRLLGGILHDKELDAAIDKMKDGDEWEFLFVDHTSNKMLPHLTYLFSVVLKCISDQLPDHPSTYRNGERRAVYVLRPEKRKGS